MQIEPSRILVVDDEPGFLRYMSAMLEAEAYHVETASSGVDALGRVQEGLVPDLVLLDMRMPELDGLETLERMRQLRPELKVIMLSCVTETRKVVQAIRLGAQDYLAKPFEKTELDAVLNHYLSAVPSLATQDTTSDAGETIEELGDDLFFVAASPAMRKIHVQVKQVANVDVPVLLLGESGSGKGVVARLIHALSSRAQGPFLKVNCAALPSELLESELFGYEAGAFTGATRPKPGQFELCNRGTILLDEFAEMPPNLQAKLLHVLQDQQFSRLGGRSPVKVDVRILAATNVDVETAIAARKLREDLYYRLGAFTLRLPSLRERRGEIPLLLKHFMARFAARYGRPPLPLSPRLVEACLRHPWPGNLRQLENIVKRCLILGDESLVLAELEAEGEDSVTGAEPIGRESVPCGEDLKLLARSVKGEAEAEAITRALEKTRWNRKRAAALLNISYRALLYKISQYGIGQN